MLPTTNDGEPFEAMARMGLQMVQSEAANT